MKNRHILVKLSKLKKKDCGHTKFDFSAYRKEIKCGTMGCLAGELPFIDPGNWQFDYKYNDVALINSPTGDTIDDLCAYFDLSESEAEHLFLPNSQDTARYGGKNLPEKASRKKVQSNLKEFLILHK